MCHSCDIQSALLIFRRFSSLFCLLRYFFLRAQVDRLAALSLRKPVRIEVDPLFDLAQRLVQDFVRVRRSREADREAMLLARLYLIQHASCLLCCSADGVAADNIGAPPTPRMKPHSKPLIDSIATSPLQHSKL
mgnify:CR=1 FL=1